MSVQAGLLILGLVAAGSVGLAQQAAANEEVARRQLESGRAFARQGNYTEALKDFRAVAETFATTSFADDALLEIARYYLDVEGNAAQAAEAVDQILRMYSTSDSAPDAYVMSGRLALARSRQGDDLKAAIANFDRVIRLFPNSGAVARSRCKQARHLGGRVALDQRMLEAVAAAGSGHDAIMTGRGLGTTA